MEDVALGLGAMVLGLSVLLGGAWLALNSPAFGSIVKLAVIGTWGALSIATPLWAAIWIHIPRHNYLAATLLIGVAIGLGFVWVAIGLPEARRTLADRAAFRLRMPRR